MAKTKRIYLFFSCVFSIIGVIFPIVSILTDEWITSEVLVRNDRAAQDKNSMSFGLFKGRFIQKYARTASYDLNMICSFDDNVCALLCGQNMKENLGRLFRRENISSSDRGCGTIVPENPTDLAEPDFFDAVIWISTQVLEFATVTFGLMAAFLSFLNIMIKRLPGCCATIAICIFNLLAFLTSSAVLLTWGLTFKNSIYDNDIPTYKTIFEGFTTKGLSQLGYSYWVNAGSLLLFPLSICVVIVRKILKIKQPSIEFGESERDDTKIYLY